MTGKRGDALVLFGATGDLARKKLFPALYHLAAAGNLDLPVIGVASSDWGDAELRDYATDAVHAGATTSTPTRSSTSPVGSPWSAATTGRLTRLRRWVGASSRRVPNDPSTT